MRFAVYLPLVLSMLLAPTMVTAALRRLPDRIDPRVALHALTASVVVLAATSTTALGLLLVGGAAWLVQGPVITPSGHTNPGGWPAGLIALLILLVVAARAVGVLVRRARRRRRVRDCVLATAGHGTDPMVLDDDAVYAVATPPVGTCPGRVVASRGLLDALTSDDELAVVLAHEQAHLDGRHHRHLALVAVAVALNPLLAPLRRDVAYAAERCADEAAARCMRDRGVTARAIGRAALAASRAPASTSALDRSLGADPALVLGATTGPVPRRVAALLRPTSAALWRRPGAALLTGDLVVPVGSAVLLLGLIALTVAGLWHAAWDMGDVLGLRDR